MLKYFTTYPTLLRSNKLGIIARRYVHVQINNKITVKRLWKLNSADCKETEKG